VRWQSEWQEYDVIPKEFVDLGDRVLATLQLEGGGRGSGLRLDTCFYFVYTLCDGKVIRMDEYTERSEALEAVVRSSEGE
jgi:ketosteroid isomerase-like protein